MLTVFTSVISYMGDSCQHLEIHDDGVCKACGVNITSQEFIDSLPEVPENANFGDIEGLIKLAQATAEEFLKRQAIERDPNNPSQPKIRWVGTQMVRLPRETIWTEVIRPTYDRAKELGYRNSFERWEDICLEYVLLMKHQKSSQKTS